MMLQSLKNLYLYHKVMTNWRKIFLISGVALAVLLVVAQFLYPADRVTLLTSVDGVYVSGWQKSDITKRLDDEYIGKTIPIYLAPSGVLYDEPKLADIGLSVSNTDRVNSANYPWYLRLVPTSILWANLLDLSRSGPAYQRDDVATKKYIGNQFGENCIMKPQDASLGLSGSELKIIPSHIGGTCNIDTVRQIFAGIKPRLDYDGRVDISVAEIQPAVSNDDADRLGNTLQAKVGDGVPLAVGGTTEVVPATELLSWMDFITDSGKLSFNLNSKKAATYLDTEIAPQVSVRPGTTVVSTLDFTEVSRVNGADGQALDVTATLGSLKDYINGNKSAAKAITKSVSPNISYERHYSSNDIGLSALMQQYAQDNPGVYGVSLIELSGKFRRASYNSSAVFTTASTYKLFVAYSVLKNIESGIFSWSDQVDDGRDYATCFDDMIVNSDNECALSMLLRVGFANLTNDANSIGCVSTSFMGEEGIKTTTDDLALFLALLKKGQILGQQSSRDRLLDAMSRNVYREGIPAGVSSSSVADKVGFMDGLLHDAAIVSGPTGTYVLVIMADGSSWQNIADLASKIEALRSN